MCNLYGYIKPPDAARKLARVARDIAGSLSPPTGALKIVARDTKQDVR
jgi:hypothetical protein